MIKAFVDTERCKECELCVEYCQKKAIALTRELNSKGYKYIEVDSEKCVGCGVCYTVCPDGVFTIKELEE